MIDVNFDPASAQECLDTIRYKEFFRGVTKKQQAATMDLLSAISENHVWLSDTFTQKGLDTEVINKLIALTPKIIEANTSQEVKKNTKNLTNEQIEAINDIYKQVSDICKIGKVIYADDEAQKRNYNLKKVVAGLN